MNQMLELSGKDFKAAIIKVLQQAIINSPETNGTIEYFSKEMSHLKNGNFRIGKYNTQKK